MKTLAIILARGGSKGLPNKNILPVGGKPLIAHSILQAKASGACDVVLVTTDDERIAKIAREYGAELLDRPKELADDVTAPGPVIAHAVKAYEAANGPVDIVVYLQPTDLFRTPEMIRDCVERVKNNPKIDSAFVAYKTHKNFWRKAKDGGWERVAGDLATYESRQYRKEYLYREDTGVASAVRAPIARAGKRLGDKVDIVVTDDPKTGIDIHDKFDLWLTDKILSEWKG